jgi:hypothetical protein
MSLTWNNTLHEYWVNDNVPELRLPAQRTKCLLTLGCVLLMSGMRGYTKTSVKEIAVCSVPSAVKDGRPKQNESARADLN